MISYDSVSYVAGNGEDGVFGGSSFGPSFAQNKETPISFKFREADQNFYFIPQEVLDRGKALQTGTIFFPNVLKDSFAKDFAESGQSFSVDQLASTGKGSKFLEDFSKGNYQSGQGIVVPESFYKDYFRDVRFLEHRGPSEEDPMSYSGISGISERNGKKIYAVQAYGPPIASSWLELDNEGKSVQNGYWEIPGKKWYEKPLGIAGIGLITGGLLGLAGVGPFAGSAAGAGAGAAGAGTAGGIVGTPGVSTIFPVAAPVAPTVSTLAPIATATAVPAAQLAFPGLEVAPTFTPAPGSLQAALPGLGVETAASTAPFTAAPGSFQAALPALGIASSPSLAGNLATSGSGISATDALRMANTAGNLLGAGANPVVPQQQGLPSGGRAGGQVDYSGLLALLQARARTPGVTSLLAPAQLSPMYQSLLPPNTMSLLG
jgi:hypothetical protein